MQVEERLEDLGLELVEPQDDKGKIALAIRSGRLIFTSAHASEEQGKLGGTIATAQGYQEVQEATVRCLSAIKALIGDLDKISRVIKIQVFINCTPDFTEHVQVIHGATELLLDLFGEEVGRHVRSAAGVSQLHDNAAVAIDMIVEVDD